MRTRYQHGNLQLDKRTNDPDVWIYRWREYPTNGKMQRRGQMIGTVEDYPTKADAQKASEHLRLTANSDNPGALDLTFGALLDRYIKEEMPERHSTNMAYRSYIETPYSPSVGTLAAQQVSDQGRLIHGGDVVEIARPCSQDKRQHPQRDGRDI